MAYPTILIIDDEATSPVASQIQTILRQESYRIESHRGPIPDTPDGAMPD